MMVAGTDVKLNQNNLFVANGANIMKCYLSYSLNKDIRYRASSGGFCKEFIKFFIENKIADKAIITILGKNDKALVPETIITADIEIILSTKSNSIYDETDPLSVLQELNSNESYIFVGLPCHIVPIKTYCKRKNIKLFTVSLFCNHTPNNNKYYKSVLENIGLTKDDIKHFEYRGSGWPGSTLIITNNNNKIKKDVPKCWSNYVKNHLDMLPKCVKCIKLISHDADICVGDAWLQRIMKKDKEGTCIMLTMNPLADNFVKHCFEKKYIHLERMEDAEFDCHREAAINIKRKRNKQYENINRNPSL